MAERYADYNRDFPLKPIGRDEDGHKRYGCRRCGKRLGKRLRSFCSEECRRDVLVRCGTSVRHYVGERDKGVCARCGLNTAFLVRRLNRAIYTLEGERSTPSYWPRDEEGMQELHYWHSSIALPYYFRGANIKRDRFYRFLRRIGIEPHDLDGRSLWEAHHKHAVKDGGGGCGLEGFETLCRWCHKKESADQQRKWARDRKGDKDQSVLFERGD